MLFKECEEQNYGNNSSVATEEVKHSQLILKLKVRDSYMLWHIAATIATGTTYILIARQQPV